ncbi:ribonuclease H-like domain-containing protein [Mycena maculata]|uniref:Ribonuclease H-like domain-containing protein n=1 Tax=Mycena maculata TaxID=230809 RepID=A0AAD7HDY8_9AGAR|nr:ribonuclease H-like domain-containing protein [Mycena maculata]
MAPNFSLCADSASLTTALNQLRLSPILFIDCEGQNLGVAGGSLSLLSLRTSSSPRTTYIFDVLAFSASDIRPLFDLLELPTVQKVCFDGRMDNSAMLHNHSTAMANVLDLQLADVASRAMRSEGMEKQLARLSGSPYLPAAEIVSHRAQYTRLHKLISLGNTTKEHGIREARTGGTVDHSQWMRRPLPSSALQYAANDVYNISLLFDHFCQKGYISQSLSASSLKYVRLWSDAAPHSSGCLSFSSYPSTRGPRDLSARFSDSDVYWVPQTPHASVFSFDISRKSKTLFRLHGRCRETP